MAGSLPRKGRTACQAGDCPCARQRSSGSARLVGLKEIQELWEKSEKLWDDVEKSLKANEADKRIREAYGIVSRRSKLIRPANEVGFNVLKNRVPRLGSF
jgi:hypothetical protein